MESEKINQRDTKPIRVDSQLHRELKIEASREATTLKELAEEYIKEGLAK